MAHQQTLAPPLRTAKHRTHPVRIWLFAVAALVFAMVSVGGATRLTGSGLSITEWQPIVGVIPPLSDGAWQEALEKYRQIPQYRHVNKGMSLESFKRIFWWEWTHRLLARFVGVAFSLPFLYFLATGRIARSLVPKLAGLFALGGLQGVIGWYMVSSGLSDRIDVSQYRLALHLSLAVAIFAGLLWIALSLGPRGASGRSLPPSYHNTAAMIVGVVFLQIVAGAFVAGLRAGAGYNTWPLMDGHIVPQGLGALSPWWANLFENATTVQFNHRILAYTLTGMALWHVWRLLPRTDDRIVRMSGLAVAAAVLAQATLGIWALLAHVPLSLGLAHQAGAVTVFGVALWHLHTLRAAFRGSRICQVLMTATTSHADRVPDAPPGNWVDRLAPQRWKPYLRLARFDRPIGAWLLLFPAWWSQALAEVSFGRPYPNIWYLGLFWIGAFVMRGAGCTYNDIVDRHYDARVARTAARPIPSGQVTVARAYLFLAVLCAIGFLVLIQFSLFTILLGASSLLLISIYPFMKRITFWPQLVLGLTFKWGALVGWAAVTGWLSAAALSLYAGSVLWTIGYDTIYAHQDKEDDALLGLKSTALKFGGATRQWLVLFYTGAVFFWGTAGILAGAHGIFALALGLAVAQMAWQVATLDTDTASNCLARFKSNRLVGWLLFGGLVADMALSPLAGVG